MLQTKQLATKNKRARKSAWAAISAQLGARSRTRLSPPLAIGGLVVLTGAALLVARPNHAQNLPSTAKLAPSAAARNNSAASVVVASNVTNANVTSTRRDVAFYTGDVRATMFSEPQPYVAPVAPPPHAKKPSGPPSMPSLPSLPVDPFEGWAYTGTATIGDSVVAILENATTKDSQFVHVGDRFMVGKVIAISQRGVTLSTDEKPVTLAMSDTVNVTPLNNSAAFLTAQPQQQQPGQQMDPAMLLAMQLAAQNGRGNRGGFGGNRGGFGGNGGGGFGRGGNGGGGFGRGGNGGGGFGGGGNGGGGFNGAGFNGGGGGRNRGGGGFGGNGG